MSDTKDPFKDSFSSDNISADDAFSQPDPLQNGFDSALDDEFFKELDELGNHTNTSDNELDFLNQLGDTAQDNGQEIDFLTQSDGTPPAEGVAPRETAPVAPSSDAPPTTRTDVTSPIETITTDNVSPPDTTAVPPVAPPTNKKPLFAKNPTKPSNKGDSKKLSTLIAGVLLALLLLIGGWFLLNNGSDDVPVMVEPVPAPVVTPAPIETEPEPEPVPMPEVTAQEVPTVDTTMIDIGAIVTAEIPQDPALIKEEIDRLSDKEQRLAEQAKLIDEQLGMMAELTDAKQEQIALLEAQIAQLEAQKQQ